MSDKKEWDLRAFSGVTRLLLESQLMALAAEGWASPALEIYIRQVERVLTGTPSTQAIGLLEQAYDRAHTIGSKLFTTMLESIPSLTRKASLATLDMLYHVLDAQIDQHDFLQLRRVALKEKDPRFPYRFVKQMDRALTFDQVVASLVRQAYPTGLVTEEEKDSKAYTRIQITHQFRYYLDKKNNEALRATYKEAGNDLARIQAYNKSHPQTPLIGEKARYHNKFPKDRTYHQAIKDYGVNTKYVTSNKGFHSEFILDQQGNLISQWEVYEFTDQGLVDSNPKKTYSREQEWQLVNGNSVNYARSAKKEDLHSAYDSLPVLTYDPKVRKRIHKNWQVPVTGLKNRQNPNYFDIDYSLKVANLRLKK